MQSLETRYPGSIPVSTLNGLGLDSLRESIIKAAMSGQVTLTMDFGTDDGDILREVYRQAVIIKSEGYDEILRLTFTLPVSQAGKLHLFDILASKLEKS
jgi:50S ribosomal subunit-associated GTPase HflX